MILPPDDLDRELFILNASRAEIEAADPSMTVASLYELLSPMQCQRLRRKLVFLINGYDEAPLDLWELPEVLSWIWEVDQQWPFWFYFMNLGKHSSMSMVTFCLCPWKKVSSGKMIELEDLIPFVRQRLAMMFGLCERFADDRQTQIRMATEILEFYGLDVTDVFPNEDRSR